MNKRDEFFLGELDAIEAMVGSFRDRMEVWEDDLGRRLTPAERDAVLVAYDGFRAALGSIANLGYTATKRSIRPQTKKRG